MERITGTTTARTLLQNIRVDWSVDEDGTVTANGETAGHIVESLSTAVYAFPADGHNWEATFSSAINAAAALAARHVA
jgi:hypothetical protein